MLLVTVSLWPGGSRMLSRDLARIGIRNVSDLAPVSDYEVVAFTLSGRPFEDITETAPVTFTVGGHRRAEGMWPLIERVVAKLAAIDKHPHERGGP